jgi:hypothetical protein
VAIQIQKYRSCSAEVEAFRTPCALEIPNVDGAMRAAPGDWILIDESGEQHPCAPDVFAETYQLVTTSETDGDAAAARALASAIPAGDAPADNALALASIRACPIGDALDVLIERLTAMTTATTPSDAGDREHLLALAKLEEARLLLGARADR